MPSFSISTQGHNETHDITPQVEEIISQSGVKDGAVVVFVPGSTAAVTTIEYESGVIEDLKRAISELVPEDREYQHDSNGYAHVRAALLKPDLVIPLENNQMQLGTWQQIVLIDFDNRPREREIIVKVIKNA